MKIFDTLKAWLKAIYIKPVPAPAVAESQTPEVNTVSEPIVDAAAQKAVDDPAPTVYVSDPTAPADAAATSVPAIAITEHEKILAKVKDILVFLGHDVEAVFDEAVALAKKL